MLIAEPDDVMNIAFAGQSHFSVREHGIGIWLKLGRFRSQPERCNKAT